MTNWIVRVEGVNFANTLFDTRDLSTVRGSSLTMLALPEAVEDALAGFNPVVIFAGASLCAFRIVSDLAEVALRESIRDKVAARLGRDSKDGPAFRHICAVVDIAPAAADEEQALRIAEARNKTNQLRMWSIPPVAYDPEAIDADSLDGLRPASVEDSLRGKLSPSVKVRRDYGRKARSAFYDRLPEAERPAQHGYEFSEDFEDIVAVPPSEVALSAKSKIAVFYSDGNSFGKRREKTGSQNFSAELTGLQDRLLKHLVGWLRRGARENFAAYAVKGHEKAVLRFETLIWGGDEAQFVLPAWLAVDFVSFFLSETADWDIDGPLTHAIGVVVAHHKTPIRQLSRLAHKAADLSKSAKLNEQSSVIFEIFESQAPPDTSLSDARRSTFGIGAKWTEQQIRRDLQNALVSLSRQLAMPGATFNEAVAQMRGLADFDGLPRSQLYSALRAAQAAQGSGDLTGPLAIDAAKNALELYQRRAGGNRFNLEGVKLPAFDGGRPLTLDLALLATLWDYVPALKASPTDARPVGATT